MEWLNNCIGKTIGLDTAPLIYFIEEHPKYFDIVKPFFEAIDAGKIRVVTSTVTLLEVLVHPLKNQNLKIAEEYREILLDSNLVLLDVSPVISEKAAQLRAQHNIRTPDAIQIATALNAGASVLLTNDIRLPDIQGLKILCLDGLDKA